MLLAGSSDCLGRPRAARQAGRARGRSCARPGRPLRPAPPVRQAQRREREPRARAAGCGCAVLLSRRPRPVLRLAHAGSSRAPRPRSAASGGPVPGQCSIRSGPCRRARAGRRPGRRPQAASATRTTREAAFRRIRPTSIAPTSAPWASLRCGSSAPIRIASTATATGSAASNRRSGRDPEIDRRRGPGDLRPRGEATAGRHLDCEAGRPVCVQSQLREAGPRCTHATMNDIPSPRGTVIPYARKLIARIGAEWNLRSWTNVWSWTRRPRQPIRAVRGAPGRRNADSVHTRVVDPEALRGRSRCASDAGAPRDALEAPDSNPLRIVEHARVRGGPSYAVDATAELQPAGRGHPDAVRQVHALTAHIRATSSSIGHLAGDVATRGDEPGTWSGSTEPRSRSA